MRAHPRRAARRIRAFLRPKRHRTDPARAARRPGSPGGLTRLHLGCGPHNQFADWWNVDIRPFAGVDEVVDVTRPWPWTGLDAVYGEHLLEHLELDGAWRLLLEAGRALRPGGVLRLSTPSLEWVWLSQFDPSPDVPVDKAVLQTYTANRAFHGWGHRFLYSRAMLEHLLLAAGFADLRFEPYGQSSRPALRGLERHTDYGSAHGYQHVWIVEAVRGDELPTASPSLGDELEREYLRYVRSGH